MATLNPCADVHLRGHTTYEEGVPAWVPNYSSDFGYSIDNERPQREMAAEVTRTDLMIAGV